MARILDWLGNPISMRRFHGWATVAWLILSVPICILLANSLAFVVWVSVYAVVVSHFAAWQAARAEVAADPEIAA